MYKEKIRIWEENEYNYSMALGFVPHFMTYLHEGSLKACNAGHTALFFVAHSDSMVCLWRMPNGHRENMANHIQWSNHLR